MKRSRLRPQSAKRQAEADERFDVRSVTWHRAGGHCEAERLVPAVACGGPLDVDEIAPRSALPGGHLDPANTALLCRRHHDWKGANPEAAHAVGLRRWSWEGAPAEHERLVAPPATLG